MVKITIEVLDELVTALCGEDVLPLMHILWNKNNVSEFKLAEMLNVTVNQTRNMLYRCNEHNLVSFLRKKDKKKGWYIYYWSLNRRSAENALLKFRERQHEEFKQRLGREEEGIFYVCPMGCMRLKMEQAMEYDFKCQECGALLVQQDNTKTIANIKKRVNELEKELAIEREEQLKRELAKQKLFAAKKAREEKEALAKLEKEKKRLEKKAAKKLPVKETKKPETKKPMPTKRLKAKPKAMKLLKKAAPKKKK